MGRGALLAGLDYLRNKGVAIVELTVDSENEVADNLYRSLGFTVAGGTLWYEKAVSRDTGDR